MRDYAYGTYNHGMSGILLAFFTSFIATLLIIRTQRLHGQYSADHDLSGPQKFHLLAVPRIGGIAIGLGVLLSTILRWLGMDGQVLELVFIFSALFPFSIGVAEDITKKISVSARLIAIAIGGLAAVFLLDIKIGHLNIWGLDSLLSIPAIAVLFTVFAITGLSNAYNIIDGFNGLASMVAVITLISLGYVAFKLGDFPLLYLSITMAASILGFFIWNYPRGLIFLGDGGAYLIGFWIALISILMVTRHPEVSPWFALMINGYPILETLFTMYRRVVHQRKSPGTADGIHIHTLFYRRVLKFAYPRNNNDWYTANAKTAPFLWSLAGISVMPAILWWQSTTVLMVCAAIFVVFYIYLYKRIISFNAPAWLRIFY